MSDPARDYSVGPPPRKPTVEEFRAFVAMHLRHAMDSIPDKVPTGMMDPCVMQLQDELDAIETYLYELDAEERHREDAEDARDRRARATRRDATLEETVRQIDYQVQKAVEVLGMPVHRAPMLDGLTASSLLRALLRLMDKFPRSAFDARWFEWRSDPRIAALGAVLYSHHKGEVSQ